MGHLRTGLAGVRSILTIDPLDAPGAETSASADALLIDLSRPVNGHTGRAKQTEGAAAMLDLLRKRAYRPVLLVKIASLDDERADGDLDAVMPGRPDGIVLTGCPNGAALQRLGIKIAVREARCDIPDGTTFVVADAGAAAQGMLALRDFRTASPRLVALSWDAAALAAHCGGAPGAFAEDDVPATVARTLLSLGAAAAGVAAYDSPSAAQGEVFARECAAARRLGFTGKIARDPGQVAAINRVFGAPGTRAAAARA